MSGTNCPNCGAAYDPHKNKCPYCGTYYFDMSCLDLVSRQPFYLKLKVPYCDGYAYVTQLVVPQIGNIFIECESDYLDCSYLDERYQMRIIENRNITTTISFSSICQENGCIVEVEKNKKVVPYTLQ